MALMENVPRKSNSLQPGGGDVMIIHMQEKDFKEVITMLQEIRTNTLKTSEKSNSQQKVEGIKKNQMGILHLKKKFFYCYRIFHLTAAEYTLLKLTWNIYQGHHILSHKTPQYIQKNKKSHKEYSQSMMELNQKSFREIQLEKYPKILWIVCGDSTYF